MEEACKLCGQSTYGGYRSPDGVRLKEYIDTRFDDIQIAVDRIERALSKKHEGSKDYVDVRFTDVQKTFDAYLHDIQTTADTRFATAQVATDKAELELVSKFREERTYVDMRLADLLTVVNVHFTSIQIAIDKADVTMTARLDKMNEFRAQLKDQAAQFVSRAEFGGLKDQSVQHVTRAEFAAIQKLVYIGLGAVLAIELLLKFITK